MVLKNTHVRIDFSDEDDKIASDESDSKRAWITCVILARAAQREQRARFYRFWIRKQITQSFPNSHQNKLDCAQLMLNFMHLFGVRLHVDQTASCKLKAPHQGRFFLLGIGYLGWHYHSVLLCPVPYD